MDGEDGTPGLMLVWRLRVPKGKDKDACELTFGLLGGDGVVLCRRYGSGMVMNSSFFAGSEHEADQALHEATARYADRGGEMVFGPVAVVVPRVLPGDAAWIPDEWVERVLLPAVDTAARGGKR